VKPAGGFRTNIAMKNNIEQAQRMRQTERALSAMTVESVDERALVQIFVKVRPPPVLLTFSD
jgi:hypothetical protein